MHIADVEAEMKLPYYTKGILDDKDAEHCGVQILADCLNVTFFVLNSADNNICPDMVAPRLKRPAGTPYQDQYV